MNSGVKKEWYLGGGEWTKAEMRGIIRRMKKRGITTDEAIGPRQRVTLTVIRGGKDAQEGGAA